MSLRDKVLLMAKKLEEVEGTEEEINQYIRSELSPILNDKHFETVLALALIERTVIWRLKTNAKSQIAMDVHNAAFEKIENVIEWLKDHD